MSSPSQPARLTDVVGAILKRWPIVVAGMAIGAVTGAAAAMALPTSYDATATVSVRAMNAGPLAGSVEAAKSVNMPTEAQVARSPKVASVAAKALSGTREVSAESVAERTSVVNPEESLILKVTYSASSPDGAARGANAVANAYLSVRESESEMSLKRLRASLDKRLADVRREARKSPSDIEARAANAQADRLAEQLAALANLDPSPGQIIGQATAPTSSTTPGVPVMALGGLVLGLIVAAPIAAARRNRTDTTVADASTLSAAGPNTLIVDGTRDSDVDETFNIAALMIPAPAAGRPSDSVRIVVDSDPGSADRHEAAKRLADALSRRGIAAKLTDLDAKSARGKSNGRINVHDTTKASIAHTVDAAAQADAVVLVRAVGDDAAQYERLCELLRHSGVVVTLAVLLPRS